MNRQQRLRKIVMACALAIGLQVSYADSPNGGPPSGPNCTAMASRHLVDPDLPGMVDIWPETEFTLQT